MGEQPYRIYFDRKGAAPDDAALRRALGEAYSSYKEILTLTGTLAHEWKFYGAKYGWQHKALHKGRALYYLVPLENSFRIAFGVREKEREALLKAKLPAGVREDLRAAKKYPEGYPLRLSVAKGEDLKPVRAVIEALLSMRP